ncbi:unnamed protein product [Mesocestoides corti]|uniref:Homeobox domain-containing protein n=1 Tax=Mesocestoides corti TaxID=53468 RepID=A0A0R3U2N2_MESCO|nr:unnamed protein product [Mesocestoides corti]
MTVSNAAEMVQDTGISSVVNNGPRDLCIRHKSLPTPTVNQSSDGASDVPVACDGRGKVRVGFSEEQVRVLKERYLKSTYVSPSESAELARCLGLTDRQESLPISVPLRDLCKHFSYIPKMPYAQVAFYNSAAMNRK